MKILYLYAEVMGYTMATIKAMVEKGAEVHVVHWDEQKLTPYQVVNHDNVHMYPRSTHSLTMLRTLASKLNPDITVVSGWQDKIYLRVVSELRKQGKIVVSGFDDQWHGRLRQHIAAFLGKFRFFSRYYSHAWVTGVYQYEYARKLGFQKQEILFDLYSADLMLFDSAYEEFLEQKNYNYPHKFLFVGRLEPVKGLDCLLRAWRSLDNDRRDWQLYIIGNGSLKEELSNAKDIVIKEFMQPCNLIREVAGSGCFILPSREEPWGVVVHEFAAAGLPIIVSDTVGAASTFLVDGFNGYSFRANNADFLSECMRRVIALSDDQLLFMGKASHELAHRITPHTSAANLLSVLSKLEHKQV